MGPAEFIKFVIAENRQKVNLNKINEHWRPQASSCPFCKFDYSVIGKFETIHEDTAYILHKAHLLPLLKVGKINQSNHKNSRRKDFWSKIPEHYINDLREIFKIDFDLFQY